MTWNDVVTRLPRKVVSETRAGILVGVRVDLSDAADLTCAVMDWVEQQPTVTLWVVDDVQGLADTQPIFVGVVLTEVFGLEGDHRKGLTPAALERLGASAKARMTKALPALKKLVGARIVSPVDRFLVWSGPLCGARLVKGVFEPALREGTLSYETDAPLRTWLSSRGARQDPADGGVFGAILFRAEYDNSVEPPRLTTKLLDSGNARLKRAGLLGKAKLFVLPRYD